MSDELDQLCINTLRFLSVDAVQKANSGHPGMPLGAAPMAYVLWTRVLKHHPHNPDWFDRDRFVLSAGHGSMLLYSLLHLTGYDLSLDEIKRFRQWGSKTPGFVVATAVAIAVQRLAVPYTVALVVTGLVLGLLHAFEAPHLTKALLFSVFLPGLLFEAAFHIESKQFRENRIAVSSLALPGVVAAIALTAMVLTPVVNAPHFVQGFTWTHALVFGALISATDPIAVVAIFKNLGVPKRLALSLEGESLLNAGLDDLRSRHSFDPCPRVDDVPTAAMVRHCARTPQTVPMGRPRE